MIELSGHHNGACRYCHGQGHDFQCRTEREWIAACNDAKVEKKPQPHCRGGYEYNITKRPHPHCPECNGLGVPYVWFADTRDLSPEAQILFEGVKQTKDGMEIIQASKAKAFDLLARHKGLMTQKHEHSGKDGKPIQARVKARIVIVPAKMPAEIKTRDLPPH